MRRLATLLVLLVVWGAFGFGVNRYLASRKSNLTTAPSHPVSPVQETPAFSLPGTVYVTQGGHMFRFHGGHFTDLNLPANKGSWIQPAVVPGGRLLAVVRSDAFSDLYLLDGTAGTIVQQLTANASRTGRVELSAWAYWPHLASDGDTVFFNYDGPKTGQTFQVDFAVWSGSITGKLEDTRWTTANGYTGGDVSAFPVPGGAVVYASFGIAANGTEQIVSRIALISRPNAKPLYLTTETDDCSQPSVNPAGTQIAMICTSDTQSARLEVIPLVNNQPGTPRVLVDNCLCASPAWAPDGTSLLYLAPSDATGHFQLWWLDGANGAAPKAPRQVTSHLDFDATSPPAWSAG